MKKIVYRWHVCKESTSIVNPEKARRLAEIGERVTPNPRSYLNAGRSTRSKGNTIKSD